jgi:hypothetical protein
LKYSFAARQWREELDQVYAEMHSTTEPHKLEALERRRKNISEELDFISQYRMPFASTQQPRSMGEFLRVLMPRENKETQELVDGFILPSVWWSTGQARSCNDCSAGVSCHHAEVCQQLHGPDALAIVGGRWVVICLMGLKLFAERPVYIQDAANLSRSAAGYLYSTHLSSIMADATATSALYVGCCLGWRSGSAQGVPRRSLKQMANYRAGTPVEYGLVMDPQQKRDLFPRARALRPAATAVTLTMLNEDFLSTLDSAIFSGRVQRKSGIMKTIFMDMPLKFFQKVETMNRIVMAEAGLSFYEKQLAANGMRMAPMEIADNVQMLQSMANFARQATTKPRIPL